MPPAAAAAGAAEIGNHAETVLNPQARNSQTPPPPTTGSQAPPAGSQQGQSYGGRPYGGQSYGGQPYGGQSYGGQSYGGESYGEQGQHDSDQYGPGQYAAGQSGADLYPPQQQGYQQGYPGPQGYTGQQGWAGQQQYPEPQGYLSSRADPVAPGGEAQAPPGGAGSQGNSWWAGQQPGVGAPGGPQTPGGGEQWRTPPPASNPRKRRRWLLPAIAAAVILVVVVVLVLTLGSGSGKTPTAQQGATTGGAGNSASASAVPTVGNLLLKQYKVGDCLTGSNLKLNQETPWPRNTEGVPCNQAHLAEVIYANMNFFANTSTFPGGTTITDEARAACDSAFQAYVGIAYSQSEYTWTDTVPGSNTWGTGDRALHCVAYHATVSQPAGVTLYRSIKGSRQ
jgi:Septum formation